jgi:hypothetical protein
MLCLFHSKENLAFLNANWTKLALEIIQELRKIRVKEEKKLKRHHTHVLNPVARFDHFDFGDVVCPNA